MARERELTGVVRPAIDERKLGRVGDQLSETFDSAANLTPDLNLSRARRKLRSLTPGGVRGAVSGLATGGGVGAPDDDVQDKQLNELQRIRRTLSKQAITDEHKGMSGRMLAGVGGLIGGLSGLVSSFTMGVLGVGSVAADQGLSKMGKEQVRKRAPGVSEFLRQSSTYRNTSLSELGRTGFAGVGQVLGQAIGVEIAEFAAKKVSSKGDFWPDLPKLPDLPKSLKNFEWPDLPGLPKPLKKFKWPSLPDLPKPLKNFTWPKLEAPAWVRELFQFVDGDQQSQPDRPRRGFTESYGEAGAGRVVNPGAGDERRGGGGGLPESTGGGSDINFDVDIDAIIRDFDRHLDGFKQEVKREIKRELTREMVD